MELSEEQFRRYARHLILDEVGEEGQEKLLQSRVLVIGAGGLGSPLLLYLAAAGVGTIGIVDNDRVDLTNLQRQVLHTTERIGRPKAESAALAQRALNPQVQVDARSERADARLLAEVVPQADVVVDCSDNRATRYAINRACVAAHVPLVSGAATGLGGQLGVFDLRAQASPCYACLFPEGPGSDDNCATMGIFAPLAGLVGVLQAAEVLRLIHPFGEPASGQLLTIEDGGREFRRLRFARDPRCAACAGRPPAH